MTWIDHAGDERAGTAINSCWTPFPEMNPVCSYLAGGVWDNLRSHVIAYRASVRPRNPYPQDSPHGVTGRRHAP